MKIRIHTLVFSIAFVAFCIPVFGQVEFYPAADKNLRTVPDPALAEIKLINVTIAPPDTEQIKDNLHLKELKGKIEQKLQKAKINVFIPKEGVRYRLPIISNLKVHIGMLKFVDSEKYVFLIQTSLSRLVNLAVSQTHSFRTDVWKTEPAMQIVSIEDMSAKVAEIVLQQAETFINAYLEANPKGRQPADANEVRSVTAPKKQARPAAKPAVAKYEYVASKNSKVFHKPDCSSAKKISPKNLVGYNSRDEVLKAGRRPCKLCKP